MMLRLFSILAFATLVTASTENTTKKGFWQRAVLLAKKANKLGVKAIDGEETARENYFLSFNSFSVEKK